MSPLPIFRNLNVKSKRVVPLIFSAVLGLAGVYLMNQVMQGEKKKLAAERAKLYKDYKAPVKVIVAVKDIPEGATIAAEQLGWMEIPEKFIQPYATKEPAQVVGKVARVAIAEKEQVLTNKVRSPDERPRGVNLSDITPEGKRAITIVTDAITGVGGFVRPGDKVDILWTLRVAGPSKGNVKNPEELVTLTLFQDVLVLGVNNQLMGRRPGGAPEEGASRDSTVTLALSPNEAALVLFAREQGRGQLSLRTPKDAGQQVAVQPANMDTVMQAVLGPPQHPVETPDTRTVEVYRGLERDLVTVESP